MPPPRKAPAAAAAAANAAAAGGTEDDADDGTLGESLSAEMAVLKSELAALAAQVAALQHRIDASSGSNASAGASASVAVHPFENCASLRDLLDMEAGVNPASIQNADDRRHWELSPHTAVKATDPAKRAEEIRAFLVLVHGWGQNRGKKLPFNILRHLDGVASALRAVAKIAPALDVSTPVGAVAALLRMLSSSDIDARIAMRAVPKPERMQGLDVGPLLVSLSMYMEELSIAFSAASETSQKAPGIKIEAFGLFLGSLPPPLRSFVQQALNFTMNGSGMSHLSVSSLYNQVETTLLDDSLSPAALANLLSWGEKSPTNPAAARAAAGAGDGPGAHADAAVKAAAKTHGHPKSGRAASKGAATDNAVKPDYICRNCNSQGQHYRKNCPAPCSIKDCDYPGCKTHDPETKKEWRNPRHGKHGDKSPGQQAGGRGGGRA
jgi:hypothetical protein